MDLDRFDAVLEKSTVDNIRKSVERTLANNPGDDDTRTALIDLLLTIVAHTVVAHPTGTDFHSQIDVLAERLRSTCAERYASKSGITARP